MTDSSVQYKALAVDDEKNNGNNNAEAQRRAAASKSSTRAYALVCFMGLVFIVLGVLALSSNWYIGVLSASSATAATTTTTFSFDIDYVDKMTQSAHTLLTYDQLSLFKTAYVIRTQHACAALVVVFGVFLLLIGLFGSFESVRRFAAGNDLVFAVQSRLPMILAVLVLFFSLASAASLIGLPTAQDKDDVLRQLQAGSCTNSPGYDCKSFWESRTVSTSPTDQLSVEHRPSTSWFTMIVVFLLSIVLIWRLRATADAFTLSAEKDALRREEEERQAQERQAKKEGNQGRKA